MLLAQTSSRSLRRPLLPLSSCRSLSSSFIASYPRGRPGQTLEGTRRTLGSLVGFKGRPPHRDNSLSSSSSSSAPKPRAWSKLLPSTWATKFLSTPLSRTIKKEETAGSPLPPPPPPAPPPEPSSSPLPSSSSAPPPPPAAESPAAPPSSAAEPVVGASTPAPPPPPHPELPSEETLVVLQATIVESLHVGRTLHGKTLSSPRGDHVPPEPIVGVYCPLEGGSYVLDAALEEIASRLGGDLVELDAIELAAEGLGSLGPATSAIPLSPNPLKIGRTTNTNSNGLDNAAYPAAAEEDADEEADLDDEDDFLDDFSSPPPPPPRPKTDGAVDDHSFSSSMATRSNDWKAGATAVAEATSKEDQSSAPKAGKETAVEKKHEQDGDEEVNELHPHEYTTTFSTLEELNKKASNRSASPGSSKEILSRLFNEIVNAERVTPNSPSVDLASPSLDETSLLPTSTPPIPSTTDTTSTSTSTTTSSPISPSSPETSPSSSSEPISPKPRIIYIKNAIDMAGTFSTSSSGSRPSWFSELLLAVQGRREAGGPTTIVLGLTPSFLSTATATAAPRQYQSTLADLMASISGSKKSPTSPLIETTLWAASAESRPVEAKTRALTQRIQSMMGGEWANLLPSFEPREPSSSSDKPRSLSDILSRFPPPPAGFIGMPIPFSLISPTGRGGKDESSTENNKTLWKVVGVLPRARELPKEKTTRKDARRKINELLFSIGAKTSHAVLEGSSRETLDKSAVFRQRLAIYEEDLKEVYRKPDRAPLSEKDVEAFKEASRQLKVVNAKLEDHTFEEAMEEFDKLVVTAPVPGYPAKHHHSLFYGRLENTIFSWEEVVDLSGLAAGLVQSEVALSSPSLPLSTPTDDPTSPPPSAPPITPTSNSKASSSKDSNPRYGWDRLSRAFEARRVADRGTKGWLNELAEETDAKESASVKGKAGSKSGAEDGKPDPVVEAVKKDPKLSKHEQKIIGTIVDPNLIRDSFSDVHLPDKTVDAIRSVVSLPLLFPEAFSTGILKNHSTSGALLFGPPGTGKTLLVRALAKESGARMMSIQPSDVMDMYFGEAEKLVKAVFKVARRLAPCIIFVDEIDALFQARSAGGGGGGGGGDSARRQMLTEFMQEMDGLNSSAENREKGLILIGATNRPQDLDEAVLRRLPRRLLIDLPGAVEREAILRILLRTENLGPDVDLKQVAKDTPSYSGSDLKHLCVVAAQEAVKELYTVPWAKKSTSTPAEPSTPSSPPPTSSSTAAPADSSTPETPSPLAENVPTTKPTEESKPAPTVEPTPTVVPDATPSPSSPPSPPTASLGTSADLPSDEPSADPSTPQPAPSSDATTLLSLPEDPTDLTAVPDIVAPNSSPESSSQEPSTPVVVSKIKIRILTNAHFKIALANSSSSGSEEAGALPELRKWNDQFGDAGTKKNKKSGFGKGFGFGETKKEGGGKDVVVK